MSYKTKFLICLICIISLSITSNSFIVAKQSPIADAGDNLYLDSGDAATLHGSGEDVDSDALDYLWDCTDGSLSASNIAEPKYTAPNIIAFDNRAIITCTLTVKDEDGLWNSDSIKIYVNYRDKEDILDIDVKTKSATDVYSNKATLNGYFETKNTTAKYVWFEYGFSRNYKNKTYKQSVSENSDYFSQKVLKLFLNGEYHYRAVVEDENGNIFYGQDAIFTTASNYTNSEASSYTIIKKVRNLTSGQSFWADSVEAKPLDIVCFSVTITAKNNLTNLIIKETLPASLAYNGALSINSVPNYYDNLFNGINLGNLSNGQSLNYSYQAKVAAAYKLNYGVTAVNSTTKVASDQQTESTYPGGLVYPIIINNNQVAGANTMQSNYAIPTDISTGLTNDFWRDSFFWPLLLIVFCLWFYFSGYANKLANQVKKHSANH